MQIAQFVIDLGTLAYLLLLERILTQTGFVYFASWDYFTSTYVPTLPHVGTCAGDPYAAVAGDVILSSYLVLFISFYIATYRKQAGRRSASKVAHKAERKMEKTEVPMMKETAERATNAVKTVNACATGVIL